MKHIRKLSRKRACCFLISGTLVLSLGILFAALANGSGTVTVTAAANKLQGTITYASPPTKNAPEILFKCPDGRMGLHIVHTRFLVSQAKANLLFQASRLQLLNTFLIPCLRAQTNKQFVIYVSYDSELSPPLLTAMHAALNATGIYVLASPERHTAMGMNYSQIISKLRGVDPRIENVELYITSRLDVDDAAHVRSVEAVQNFACSGGASISGGGGSIGNKNNKMGEPPPLRVAYIQGGQLWFPSKNSSRPYGEIGIWKTWKEGIFDDIYKFLAIMQSMIMSGQDFIKQCEGLDVYGYPHYRPETLSNISIPGCPSFNFKPDIKRTNKYMLLWDPPAGELGNFYVRTTSSWTHEKIDLYYRLESANSTTLQRSFGIFPADLAGVNLLFSGFEGKMAASHLLLNNSNVPIE